MTVEDTAIFSGTKLFSTFGKQRRSFFQNVSKFPESVRRCRLCSSYSYGFIKNLWGSIAIIWSLFVSFKNYIIYDCKRSLLNVFIYLTERKHKSKKVSTYIGRVTLREKCPYLEIFWSVFSRIRTEYGEILRVFPYSV